MPYKPTGRPSGRPPKYPELTIRELEAKAASLREQARRRQCAADEKIARLLESGRTLQQVAQETATTIGHVRVAKRRHLNRLRAESKTA